MNDVLLACSKPYEGRPTVGFTIGKCRTCDCEIFFDQKNFEKIVADYGQPPQLCCVECFSIIMRTQPEEIASVRGMVEGETIHDQVVFFERAKQNRLSRGGTK